MAAKKKSEHRVGAHVAWMGADDIAVQRLVGSTSFEDLQSFAGWERGLWEGRASVRLILDVTEGGPFDVPLQGITALYDGSPPRYVAIVGASFSTRSIANIVVRAARILGGRTVEVRFFHDEAAGRAWLVERRAPSESPAWA